MLLVTILVALAALQAWVWRNLAARVAGGTLTRLGAIVRYVLWALTPLGLLLVAFLAAVALEEWLGAAVIPELLGRAVLPLGVLVLGVAGLGSIGFGIRSIWLNRPAQPTYAASVGESRRDRFDGREGER